MLVDKLLSMLKKKDIKNAYPYLVALSFSRRNKGEITNVNDDAVNAALKTYADSYLKTFTPEVRAGSIKKESTKHGRLPHSNLPEKYDEGLYRGPDPKLAMEEYEKLSSLHNRFQGKRIFVMGNGPSLNNMDLEYLKKDYVFCLNRVSLLLDRVSWTPEFYAAFDLTVVPDNLDEFNNLDISHKFFATKHKGAINEKESHYWYHDNSRGGDLDDRFSPLSATTGFGGGGTVTTVAIQLAFYMGFDPIILIGCDASYTVPKTVEQSGPDKFKDGTKLFLESTQDDDHNHFDPRYFGRGKKWHNPNVPEMHRGFDNSYKSISKQDRTIVNATRGGSLECIPRCNYDNLFISGVSLGKKIVVGIDLTSNIANKSTGMRNYLLGTLSNIDLFQIELDLYLICNENNSHIFNQFKPKCAKVIKSSDKSFEELIEKFDCIHFPFNSVESCLSISPKTKKIVSIHDLIPMTQKGFPEAIKETYKEAAKNADAIICLSEPTRKLVCDSFNFPLSKCFVSPPYVGDKLFIVEVEPTLDKSHVDRKISEIKNKYKLRFPYVLYPAAYRPHKNHDTLINAMRYVYTNLHLVLTTGESHDPSKRDSLIDKIEKMHLKHRIHVLGNVSEDDFHNLYKGSVAVVFPSLDEGFGIPVSEAQSLSIPVLASRCGALFEVAKGSIEIDPHNVQDIADKINAIHSDEELRSQCIKDGLSNVRRFTKEAGAKGLLDAYFEALRES